MRRGGLTSWLCLILAVSAGAQNPRWTMGSFGARKLRWVMGPNVGSSRQEGRQEGRPGGLTAAAGAPNPRWVMGKGNSFTRLEERLAGRERLIAPSRATPVPADFALPRASAWLPEFDSTLIPTVFSYMSSGPERFSRSLPIGNPGP